MLNSPALNKGTAFSLEERKALALTGLLPAHVSTLEIQVKRAFLQYQRLPDVLSKKSYLAALHDRNEVLFYRLFSEHLREMIPVVTDLTVGAAMANYHHECRRSRGVYLSIDHPEEIEEAFTNAGAGPDDVDLIVATDAGQVMGIGDWGIGGIEASIGKLAICTAAGGIDPARAIPVMLDVGTNCENLLNDPAYIGNRHQRISGESYDAFIEAYVEVATRLFPDAILQWEDFAPGNGRRILEKYQGRLSTFNDDMQGTGAITLAAAISAVRVCGIPLHSQRVVIFGSGTAGIGIAHQIRDVMVREGLSIEDAGRQFWCVDRHGLLSSDVGEAPRDYQAPFARPASEIRGWKRGSGDSSLDLADVVRHVKPTMLVGASGAGESFTEAIVRDMAAHTERPILFMLSAPQGRAEANPADLIRWTDGRALVATGFPAPPITYKGVTYVVAQINNAMIYPGLALGAIVSRASRISGGMLVAAASAVSSMVTVRQPGVSLLPHIDDLRAVSAWVAVAVVEAAEAEGLARRQFSDIVQQVQDAMWQPQYRPILVS